jgi:hypothetical protein
VRNWKITLESQTETHIYRRVSYGGLFTLRILKRIVHICTIYQGGTAGIKPSRPFYGMRGFFYLSIGNSVYDEYVQEELENGIQRYVINAKN